MLAQVPRLLFATTALLIFCYLLFWYAFSDVPTGGEYWGIHVDRFPSAIARGDYHDGRVSLLGIKTRSPLGTRYAGTPGVAECAGDVPESKVKVRWVDFGLLEEPGEAMQAARFAILYNRQMILLLNHDRDAQCVKDDLEPYADLTAF